MSNVVQRMIENNKKSTFGLQLTAMVDMFTILLVFLLKSHSTSAVHITPQDGLELPVSTTQKDPVEALRLVVSKEGIFIDDRKVVDIVKGLIDPRALDRSDKKFIPALFKELDKKAESAKEIADKNTAFEFEGKVVMQADAALPYEVLQKVMYTASMAGYADLKLATISAF